MREYRSNSASGKRNLRPGAHAPQAARPDLDPSRPLDPARRCMMRALGLGALGLGVSAISWGAVPARAQHGARHALSMHGAPDLAREFAYLPYADPSAPQGGTLRLGELGGYDSLNPYILKGRAPWAVRALTVESLMGRSWDEPFSLYGLLAENVATGPEREWVEFTLRPEARFSNGAPVTVDDVIWSMEILAAEGLPGFRNVWSRVATTERTGPRSVRFAFAEPDREAALILGLRPILQRAQFDGRRAFSESSLEPLIGSGPYIAAQAEPGRSVLFRRDPDWWGEGLPFNAGRWNLAEIRHEWFKDDAAMFEAFRAGELDLFREGDPARWDEGYDFPAVRSGEIVRAEIPHGRPSGLMGFAFNTRRPPFDDLRVRRALTFAFDFEWVNRTFNRGAFRRVSSFFGGSPLAHAGAAEGAELALLAPFAGQLPDGALGAPPPLPATDGSGRNRRNLRTARRLLEEAGWSVNDGRLTNADGRPFAFEILLGGAGFQGVASVFVKQLEPLGISASVRVVDAAQYQARRGVYDFDMIVNRWAASLSPGVEQLLYWHSDGLEAPGTRNYAGVASPAVDAAIDALVAAEDREGFVAAARALDRVLAAGAYVIPLWHQAMSRIAHRSRFGHPERLPLYGDWVGWLPDVWFDREA